MKNAMLKNALSEIKKTRNRFLSIFGIIAIGTGFFAGLLASCPDMQQTADRYFDDTKLMDFRLVSTYGFNENDLAELEKISGVEVHPGYFTDVFIEAENGDEVARVYSLDNFGENNGYTALHLTEGRFPEAENECLVDAGKLVTGYKLGDTITMRADGDNELSDTLTETEYEIVGRFDTPMFVSDTERGNTTIGTGAVDMLVYIPQDCFKTEVYTQVFLTSEILRSYNCYDKQYKDEIARITKKLERAAKERETGRIEEIRIEAGEEISKAEQELSDKKKEVYNEISAGEKELEAAKEQLDKAKEEIDKGAAEIADGEKQLADAKYELDKAKLQLDEAEAELANVKKQLDDSKKQLDDGKYELEKNRPQLDIAKIELEYAKKELEAAEKQLSEAKSQLDEGKAQLEQLKEIIDSLEKLGSIGSDSELMEQIKELLGISGTAPESTDILSRLKEQYNNGLAQYEDGLRQYEDGKKQYDDGVKQYQDGLKQYEDGLKAYNDGMAQIIDGYAQYSDGLSQYNTGMLQYTEGKIRYDNGVTLYEANLTVFEEGKKEYEDGLKQYEDGKKQYEDGLKELQDGKKTADKEFADAEKKIADAKQELEDLDSVEWYIFDREDNPGYAEYGQNAERIGKIAVVFPLFFVMIAILVCLTTMTRMVDEQRVQIGTLKALGYDNKSIIFKYMLYALAAAFSGALAGVLVGLALFPGVIITAYGMMYKIHAIVLDYDIVLIAGVIGASLLLVAVTVYFSCKSNLKEQPAELMRPKAPKVGKKILLERIGFIWKHLSFSQKVTTRNLFRYKRRMFMTVIGIAGCTALVLTGFGIYDSVNDILSKQFQEISNYSGMMIYEEDFSDESCEKAEKLFADNECFTAHIYQKQISVKANDISKDGYVFVADSNETISEFMTVKDRITGEIYEVKDGGVVINEKLASLLGEVKKGDEVTLYLSETQPVKVKVNEICENYSGHYIYMTESFYKEISGDDVPYNSIYFNAPEALENSEELRDDLSRSLMETDGVMAVTYKKAHEGTFRTMLQTLLLVIVVLIVSAGVLAFIVLYNLTNININERIREIATLKVLGFYDKEVSVYVFREIFLLTLLGTGAGLVLGRVLIDFIIKTIEIDMVMFGREVHLPSFLISVGITLVFAVIVTMVMHRYLKRVDMVEALKSVE